MPKDEQRYWFNQKKGTAPQAQKMADDENPSASKAAAGAEDSEAMRREIESLRKQVKELQDGSQQAAPAPVAEVPERV
jgi:polyhydroxyalkanoate synthesis regulator phasin